MAKLERQLPQDFAKLVIHLLRLVDRAFAVETIHLEIVAVDTGMGNQKDDLHLQTTLIVLDCIFLAYVHALKPEKQLNLGWSSGSSTYLHLASMLAKMDLDDE